MPYRSLLKDDPDAMSNASSSNRFHQLSIAIPAHRFSNVVSESQDDHRLICQSIEACGGVPVTYDLGSEVVKRDDLANLANRILTADIDAFLFQTAAGTKALIEAASQSVSRQRLLDCLSDMKTIAGSQRAAEALRAEGIEPSILVAPCDEAAQATSSDAQAWRNILIAIDRKMSLFNQSLALETSADLHSLRAGLESRGASITEIPPFPPLDKETQESPEARSWLQDLVERNNQGILFCQAATAWQFLEHVKQLMPARGPRSLARVFDDHLVLSLGDETAEVLEAQGIKVDLCVLLDNSKENSIGLAINEMADQLEIISNRKRIIRMTLSGPATSPTDPQAPWYNSPFMKACRGEPTEVTPIWMMRQAGRYMAEYRAVRDKVSFLELCANPQLCSEVMCTAVNRLGVDAAIIFSDLLPILVPMGCDLEFVKGDGPVIHNPVRTSADIDRIKPLESNEPLQFVMDTVRLTRNDLPADMPLIGFAGAPFTLASYMIEGGASRNYANTKKLMFSDRGAWDQLMEHLTRSISLYVRGQVDAGAQCIQLFDSWAGCLSFEDYREYVHPYVKQVIASIPVSVPVINFATGNPALLPLLADTQASVVGIDWRTRLDDAWQTVGFDRAVQGNLDPTVLLTNPKEIRRQAKVVLDQAAGRPGHIFNLGHGILPMTPVDNAIALVDAVHELSQK